MHSSKTIAHLKIGFIGRTSSFHLLFPSSSLFSVSSTPSFLLGQDIELQLGGKEEKKGRKRREKDAWIFPSFSPGEVKGSEADGRTDGLQLPGGGERSKPSQGKGRREKFKRKVWEILARPPQTDFLFGGERESKRRTGRRRREFISISVKVESELQY